MFHGRYEMYDGKESRSVSYWEGTWTIAIIELSMIGDEDTTISTLPLK